jgi:XcyI restriction endonuclease.
MAPSSDTRRLVSPSPSRQLAFHQLLVAARKTWLLGALQEALASADPGIVKRELAETVPSDAQKILAANGIRDEYVFPVPSILRAKPTLVGYYRLLLGIPQKGFYSSETGMTLFKSMEARGRIGPRQEEHLASFCKAMVTSLAELVRQVSPAISMRDVNDLPLLTLGAQFQGSNNNTIGRQATIDVFLSVEEIVAPHITSRGDREIKIRNASRRIVTISFGSDPDLSVVEMFGKEARAKVAVEIKGGSDRSNAHNRAGEAEKSHQKAKREGFRDFWTLIVKHGLDVAKLREESPTTTLWFDVTQVLARDGDDWVEFRSRLCGELGIPVPRKSIT